MTASDRETAPVGPAGRPLADSSRVELMAQQLTQARGLGGLVRSLKELRATLERHFAEEEAPDGFFDMVGERSAHHLGPIAQLRQQHVAFLRETDMIAALAQACLAGPVAEVLKQAADLARRIQQHEMRESDLLVEAMNSDADAGSGD